MTWVFSDKRPTVGGKQPAGKHPRVGGKQPRPGLLPVGATASVNGEDSSDLSDSE